VDIISALVVNDINPLAKQRIDLVLELKVKFAVHRDIWGHLSNTNLLISSCYCNSSRVTEQKAVD
jgi:hypothetical protein